MNQSSLPDGAKDRPLWEQQLLSTQAFLPPCPPDHLPKSCERRAIPGDFKYPQEPNTSQHRDAQWGHDLGLYQDGLQDAPAHDEAVKAVEEGHEVGLQAQAVHLQQHLRSEQGQECLVGCVWQVQEWDGIQTGMRGGDTGRRRKTTQ